jgi:hypothetical protein
MGICVQTSKNISRLVSLVRPEALSPGCLYGGRKRQRTTRADIMSSCDFETTVGLSACREKRENFLWKKVSLILLIVADISYSIRRRRYLKLSFRQDAV